MGVIRCTSKKKQITMKQNKKDLGLLVDSSLRWKTHIEKACSKANAVSFQIKRNDLNLSMKTKLELYKTMIVPTLIYASSCIGLSKYVSSCLGKTQKRMVKWITASNWYYKSSLTTLGILPLTMYIQINDILLSSKIIQGGYDVTQLKVPDLSYSVRGEIVFQISRLKKAVVQQSFVYRTIRLLNLLKIDINCDKQCNGKLWYSNINRFCNFDMFRNFVKNSNPMCDVALSM